MRITGTKKLFKQFRDLPDATQGALEASIARTVKAGASKARAIVPVLDGDLKAGINHQVIRENDEILGFINFFDANGNLRKNGLAANSINYGWPLSDEDRYGFNFRATVKSAITKRHHRAVSRALKKAIKEAMG